jgi:hypothetical protein
MVALITSESSRSYNYLEIFYKNVRGLWTKSSKIYDNVCSYDFKIICLTETWLNESFINQNLLPESHTAYCADRVYIISLASISDSDTQNATKRLRPSKSVGLDGVPSFVIKGCSELFVPVIKFMFNLSLSQHKSPTLWKQAAVVPVFNKGSCASVSNCRPISILNDFSEVFELIIHDHVSHYFKRKLNTCQHGFTKSKSAVTNSVTYLDFVTPLVCSERQVDAVYFDLSSVLGLVTYALLLHKLADYGLPAAYVN